MTHLSIVALLLPCFGSAPVAVAFYQPVVVRPLGALGKFQGSALSMGYLDSLGGFPNDGGPRTRTVSSNANPFQHPLNDKQGDGSQYQGKRNDGFYDGLGQRDRSGKPSLPDSIIPGVIPQGSYRGGDGMNSPPFPGFREGDFNGGPRQRDFPPGGPRFEGRDGHPPPFNGPPGGPRFDGRDGNPPPFNGPPRDSRFEGRDGHPPPFNGPPRDSRFEGRDGNPPPFNGPPRDSRFEGRDGNPPPFNGPPRDSRFEGREGNPPPFNGPPRDSRFEGRDGNPPPFNGPPRDSRFEGRDGNPPPFNSQPRGPGFDTRAGPPPRDAQSGPPRDPGFDTRAGPPPRDAQSDPPKNPGFDRRDGPQFRDTPDVQTRDTDTPYQGKREDTFYDAPGGTNDRGRRPTFNDGGAGVAPQSPQERATRVGETMGRMQGDNALIHASLSSIAVDNLQSRGLRKDADVGKPRDSVRLLAEVGTVSVGSWWCETGGWPCVQPRETTEAFFVLSGRGSISDTDGKEHEFEAGDTVILPKGWTGRWDVLAPVHKVWFDNDHPRIEDKGKPIRAIVTTLGHLIPQTHPSLIRSLPSDATYTENVSTQTVYRAGKTTVGGSYMGPGSYKVNHRQTTGCFHVLSGVYFLTESDGSARRCLAGDTVVIPQGWTGFCDVVDTVRQLWFKVE